MKKVVNGKMYNTQTAEEIAYCESTGRRHTVYRKKNGEYFRVDTTQWQGERNTVQPICEEEAKEFCERFLDGDEYEKVFGAVEE